MQRTPLLQEWKSELIVEQLFRRGNFKLFYSLASCNSILLTKKSLGFKFDLNVTTK